MSHRYEETLPPSRSKLRKSLSALPNTKVDKENVTADLGILTSQKREPREERSIKKLRSKSIGPGGLDVLRDRAENAQDSPIMPPPRSILKPTMPVLGEIPTRCSQRSPNPKKMSSPVTPVSPSVQPQVAIVASIVSNSENPSKTSTQNSPRVLVENKVNHRTVEQQKVLEDREQGERKNVEKERREARRKSLANRRVSFAPEATLHTWDVIEYAPDSTTSSSATNLARRDSVANATATDVDANSTNTGLLVTSDRLLEHLAEDSELPAQHSDQLQKKHRRSSGIPPLNFNNPDDEFLSSSPYSSSSASGEEDVEFGDNASSDTNSDLDEGTVMSLDVGNTTGMSVASDRSPASDGSSMRLEEALRLASKQAATQDFDFDGIDANMPEVVDEEEETISFKPWSRSQNAIMDKENLNPFSPAFKASVAGIAGEEVDVDMDVDMEMTTAVGRILPWQKEPTQEDEEMTMDMTVAMGGIFKTHAPNHSRQRTVVNKSATRPEDDDVTMDLTRAVGVIGQYSNIVVDTEETDNSGNEDMTMEFTSVVGRVLVPGARNTLPEQTSLVYPQLDITTPTSERSVHSSPMDITRAIGRVTDEKPLTANTTIGGEEIFDMDITAAVGRILPDGKTLRSNTRRLVEGEINTSEFLSSPVQPLDGVSNIVQLSAVVSETGSPSLAVLHGKSLRRSTESRKSFEAKQSSDIHENFPSTSSQQCTPQSVRGTSSRKSSPRKNVDPQEVSPNRTPSQDAATPRTSAPSSTSLSTRSTRSMNRTLMMTKGVVSPVSTITAHKTTTPNRLFQKDVATGFATPSVVLAPLDRRLSGTGIDRQGLGSPRIAAILERRSSIVVSSETFSPGQMDVANPVVRFDVSFDTEAAIDKERKDIENRESNNRRAMERQMDIVNGDRDTTLNIKEIIESLSPKKKLMKGRKSLHVGAARGILGKRPVELDDSDDDSTSGVKRLKNYHSSPVKNVKLQVPPTKQETTGKSTRTIQRSPHRTGERAETPVTAISPVKATQAITPKSSEESKTAVQQSVQASIESVESETTNDVNVVFNKALLKEEPMQLQDFLNMTSIRFMELNTTKRRHTVAPKDFFEDGQQIGVISLEACVIAGACTVPMLELFQHSCRELKKYISEGRNVVREIETETFEENPPLFHEYVSAAPDIKIMMDNQFKNVKTHARLTSKGQWYDWRTQLLNGLKAGLVKMLEEMGNDKEVLQYQSQLLSSIFPAMVDLHEKLLQEEAALQSCATEMANCDQEALHDFRQKLITLDADVQEKYRMIDEIRTQLRAKESLTQEMSDRKKICLEDIREAEKVREECRGWTSKEVLSLRATTDALGNKHGWTVTGVSGTILSMAYRSELELVFDSCSYMRKNTISIVSTNTPVDLWYIGSSKNPNMFRASTERDFFLENIRDYVRALVQHETSIKTLLDTVSTYWQRALYLNQQIRALKIEYQTLTQRKSDNSIVILSTVLLKSIATKLRFEFELIAASNATGFSITVQPNIDVVYGSGINREKLADLVQQRIVAAATAGKYWVDVVIELIEKLKVRRAGKRDLDE